MRGTLWYIFPKIDKAIKNINFVIEKDEMFLISQNFPPLNQDFVGKDIIPNPAAIVDLFSKYFVLTKTLWLEDCLSKGNDNWFIGLFKKRG